MSHEVVDIGLNPIKGYSTKVTNGIDYFSSFNTEQVSIKKDINIY
jgi:hypothetical protein